MYFTKTKKQKVVTISSGLYVWFINFTMILINHNFQVIIFKSYTLTRSIVFHLSIKGIQNPNKNCRRNVSQLHEHDLFSHFNLVFHDVFALIIIIKVTRYVDIYA